MNEFIVFVIGACGYSVIELLWRGYTHWTMALAGGICFLLMYYINIHVKSGLFAKYLLSALCITAVELIFGLIFNVVLDFNIWDYSNLPLNFYGQICLPYSVIWFFLSIPLIKFCDIIKFTIEKV